jgi:hypothetical protein
MWFFLRLASIFSKEGSIMVKGLFFSFDSLVSFLFLLLGFLLTVNFAVFALKWHYDEINNNELLLLGFSISESLVKNRDLSNSLLGSAYFDSGKNRLFSNVVDASLLSKAKPSYFGKYAVSALYLVDKSGKKFYFDSAKGNCVAFERFVLLENYPERKGILGVVVCSE